MSVQILGSLLIKFDTLDSHSVKEIIRPFKEMPEVLSSGQLFVDECPSLTIIQFKQVESESKRAS